VVVNSHALVAEALDWGACAETVKVIPNGVELPDEQSNPDSALAVVVANYRPYKGHEDLLRALSLCQSNAQVRLCGTGDAQRQVEALATELQVRERVHFVEQPANVRNELALAGFAIHPSHTEGLSNAILEEMAAGLPVIAMDVGGNPMLVEEGVNGHLLKVGDHSTLARVIDQLTIDRALRRRLGQGSRSKIEQFSWEACVGRYAGLLEALAARTALSRVGAP
jgi:glycosyltransferase involved in cell wall biosynthesis